MEETLLVGALLGFPILIKRVEETQKQTRTSQETLKETQKQTRTSQETLKEEQKQRRTSQYRDARDLLFLDNLNSRMTGIDDLWRFAETHPKEEYHNVMDVFTQFVKNPTSYEWEEGTKEDDKKAVKRKDIKEILQHISKERMAGAEAV